MGITTMKRWTALVALLVLAVSATSLQAQRVKVLDFTNTFRYNQVDNLNGVGWTNRLYTDTTGNWLGGQGLLAFEDNAAITPMVRTTLGNPRAYTPPGHATYYRAHFNNPYGAKSFLTFSNQVDDGAVFFLNGVEIQRIRCTAAPLFASLATGTIATEGTYDNFTFVATNLVPSDNVLAVIVLQSDTNSSDTVYGTTIWSENIVQVAITDQPDSTAAQVNDSVSFVVGASGWSPTYQWQYRANTNVAFANILNTPNIATNATFTIASASFGSAGFYRVIVSNPQNTVTSLVASLTVSSDVSPPEIISAVAATDKNEIYLTTDEAIYPQSATNVNNYIVRHVGSTNLLIVTNAAASGKTIRLKVNPLWLGGTNNYTVTIFNIFDTLGNVITPGTSIGVSFWKDYIPMDQSWNYNYSDYQVDSLDGINWQTNTYSVTNAGWQAPKPALFFSPYGLTSYAPLPENTDLSLGPSCYYFRTSFVLPTNNGIGTISINAMFDDGGVVYLNGREVYANNMPSTRPTTWGMRALSERGTGTIPSTKSLDTPVSWLRSGTNIIAAELHPFTLVPADIYGGAFGISLAAAIAPSVASPTNGPRPDLFALASASPASVVTNANVTYTLTATNIGQALATNVQFTAIFPTNISIVTLPAGCANASGTVTCTNVNLNTNQAAVKAIQAKVTGANLGFSLVRMTIQQTPADMVYWNNTNTASLFITNTIAAVPDIAVGVSTSPAVVGTNANINFTFSVTNLGATAASSVVAVYTNLPLTGMTVVTLPGGCVSGSGIVTCTIGSMNAGTVQTKTMVVSSAVTRTLTNKVVISSTPADANTANNQMQSTAIVAPKPQLVGVTPIGTSNLSMSWQSQFGVTYVMEYKPLLTTLTWTTVLTTNGTGSIITAIPPIPSPVSPTRFYRVRAQ